MDEKTLETMSSESGQTLETISSESGQKLNTNSSSCRKYISYLLSGLSEMLYV